jgi:hypothetical protein
MVDNLYTFDQIRAALPDNTSNLISPENVRSSVLSLAVDAGEVGDDTPFLMALTAGVPLNLNATAPSATSEVLRGWTVDGNNALVNDLAATFTIAPGLTRGLSITFAAIVENAGGADDSFTFDLLKGAAIVASATATLQGGAQAEDVGISFNALELYEPALEEPWSIQVTSAGGADLSVSDWDLKVIGIVV